jgi:hypothetical protein
MMGQPGEVHAVQPHSVTPIQCPQRQPEHRQLLTARKILTLRITYTAFQTNARTKERKICNKEYIENLHLND